MTSGASDSRLKRLLHSAREYLTDWAIAGTILTLTGFAPEHWFADLLRHLAIPERIRQGLLQSFDIRIGLVAAGIAIIAWDVLRRTKRKLQPVFVVGPQTALGQQTPDNQRNDNAAHTKISSSEMLALPDKPSIAVLPFTNMSGDSGQEYFTDGITEDIITELSRFHSLFVIARNSSFTYKGKAVDIKQIGSELGVRYVLEGSIRRENNRIRVTAQLIDAPTGQHIWAEKYDRILEDIFAVQEEVTQAIVAAIAPHIETSEVTRTRTARPSNLSAYEIAMRAWSAAWVGFNEADRNSREDAIRLAREALAIDPRCSAALRTITFTQWQHVYFGTAASRVKASSEGIDAATRAIAIDNGDHVVYLWKGALLFNSGQPDAGLTDLRHAVMLNPNDALGLAALGFWEAMAGDSQKGVECTSRALRLSPRDPMRALFLNLQAWPYFVARNYAKAAESSLSAIGEAPKMVSARFCLVVSYVGLANIERAKSEFQILSELAPEFTESRLSGESFATDPIYRTRVTTFLRIAAGFEDPSAADAIR